MRLTTREITRVAIFAALHVAAAVTVRYGGEAMVPFSLVPFMVFFAGFLLGGKLGALSMVVYLLLGLIGLPVFARPPFGGLTYILQPSFGFLISFVAVAYIAGKIGVKTPARMALSILFGVLAMYAIGLPYLYFIVRVYLNRPVTFLWAMRVGMMPFVAMDIVKAIGAGILGMAIIKRMPNTSISQ